MGYSCLMNLLNKFGKIYKMRGLHNILHFLSLQEYRLIVVTLKIINFLTTAILTPVYQYHKYHKENKREQKLYCIHSELIVKYNVGLKNLFLSRTYQS